MSKCEHDFVYGQEPGDFERDAWQKKCLKCGYKTYVISRPSLKPPKETL